MKTTIKKISEMDPYISIPSLILLFFGIINVYSASSNMASGSQMTYLIKQTFFVFFAIAMGWITYKINFNVFRKKSNVKFMMITIIILLLIARFLMPPINGAHGWINLKIFSIQPAEFAKVGLIIYFADYFSKINFKKGHLVKEIFNIKYLILPIIILSLITIMPDMGNVAICTFIILVILLSSGISYRWALVGYTGILLLWLFLSKLITAFKVSSTDYKAIRLISFTDPWEYIRTSGAQLINSYYAISNGGLFGVGLGNSIQKTGYLPEPNTDFIVAVMVEELGSVTLIFVLVLILIIIGRIVHLAAKTNNRFLSSVLFGIAAYFIVQVLFNLGAVSGMLPITGVTFPFMSYGGSSALVVSLLIGLALNASAVIKIEQKNKYL